MASQWILQDWLPLDYLMEISSKTNMATNEGNSRNEIGHWANNELGVVVESWLWVWDELMAW